MDELFAIIVAMLIVLGTFALAVLALAGAVIIGVLWCIVRMCAIFRGHGLDAAGTAGGL